MNHPPDHHPHHQQPKSHSNRRPGQRLRLRPRPQMKPQPELQPQLQLQLQQREAKHKHKHKRGFPWRRAPKTDLLASLVLFLLTLSCLPRSGTALRSPRKMLEERGRCVRSGSELLGAVREFYTTTPTTSTTTTTTTEIATARMATEMATTTPTASPTSATTTGSSDEGTSAAETYGGWRSRTRSMSTSTSTSTSISIEQWCLSPEVLEQLDGDTSLGNDLAEALESIVETSEDDAFDNPEATDLVYGWDRSARSTLCTDVCARGSADDDYKKKEVEEDKDKDKEKDSESVTINDNGNDNDNHYDNEQDGNNVEQGDELELELLLDTEEVVHGDEGGPSSGSDTRSHRNSTTTSMLIRLIPIKLVAFLSLMCLVLGVRQMLLSMDGDSSCWCCCKWVNSFFGSRYASYEGIDPSDVSDHQKSVEFELLQLAGSGDGDGDFDTEVVIS